MQKLTISEARNRFMRLPDEIPDNEVVAVTRRNKEVMACMSWELYEGLLETMEILADPDLMKMIKKGTEDIKAGRTFTIEQARKRLGI
ncbi:MAG: type II toxin-antitoxin system Phd/YefM family antitoxin [Thermodesulfobacteriota bacterium]